MSVKMIQVEPIARGLNATDNAGRPKSLRRFVTERVRSRLSHVKRVQFFCILFVCLAILGFQVI